MASWTLRCRGPTGQSTLTGVAPDMPVGQFLELLASQTGVEVGRQEVLSGFPPKQLQLTREVISAPISSLGIANGDSLTVRETSAAPAAATVPAQAAQAAQPVQPTPAAEQLSGGSAGYGTVAGTGLEGGAGMAMDAFVGDEEDPELAMAIAASLAENASTAQPAHPPAQTAPQVSRASQPPRDFGGYSHPVSNQAAAQHGPDVLAGGAAPTSVAMPDGSAVVRRVIDADNSCLFNAVGYVMERSRARAAALRKTIADEVSADPVTYNEGFLGMPNEEYCRWITQSDKWGGAIELSILCRHYGREIAAYDIQTQRCDTYGQDAGYSERVMLLYDGLHYDAMAVAAFEGAPEELDVTIFEPNSTAAPGVQAAAAKLVEACHKARQFTDTANFTLRCGVCQIGLKGEKEAVAHAKATGHQNFSEY